METWEPPNDVMSVSFALNLPPVNNKATSYQIQVTFEGDSCSSATAYSKVNGTDYAVCTTIQYGYKPSSNSTMLTVEPQATQLLTQTKTPEQVQKEAEQNGSLQVRHGFTWRYPWHRTHYVYLENCVVMFDVGISVLPFGDSFEYIECFIQRISSPLPRVIWSTAVAIAGAEFTALVVSNFEGPVGFAVALAISLVTKAGTLAINWNSVDGLIGAYVGSLFSTLLGLLRMSFQLMVEFIKLVQGIMSLAEFGFAKLYRIISVPISIAYQAQIFQRLDDLGALP